jgi:hypothetical protein
MKWALIIFLMHSPTGSVSTESVDFQTKELCEKAVSSFRYPSQSGFRVLTSCIQVSD